MTKNNQGFSNLLIVIAMAIILAAIGVTIYYKSFQKKDVVNNEVKVEVENSNSQETLETPGEQSIEENLKKIPTGR